MTSFLKKVSFFFFLLVLVYACSTEKNTLLSRSYHGMTAHYNGYFNANELLRISMNSFRSSADEDFYSLIPVELVPNEEEIIGMYPAIDTAIVKCTKVITNHSMPSNDKPSKKKYEHNRWIDENWTTIGIASYYRRDYEDAMKSFEFVKKFYKNDPSLYVGALWMAKVDITRGDYTDAKFKLDELDKAIQEEKERKEDKSKKSKSKKKKKKKEDEIAKFPKKILFDFEKTKARLAIANEEYSDAIKHLEISLEYGKTSVEKTRVHFILGQLYELEGQNEDAVKHYAKVLKGNAPFKMSFNARLKKAFLGNDENTEKALDKMLRDAKNAEYKDQIYYALAQIEFNRGSEANGIGYLHDCAFYSVNNTRQKGMAYEQLGDLSFSKRNYVPAQKYYDSCSQVITDKYPNAEAIRNKANDLASLVVAVETINYEDSVQRIALMTEDNREKYLKTVIKQIKEEDQRKKERDAERLRELQQNENLFASSETGSKWYWNNDKTKAEGLEEFKKMWGERADEDNWRRSEKTIASADIAIEEIEVGQDSIVEAVDTLTVEYMTSKLPISDSSLALSNERLLEAHYNAGIIYKDQLSEEKLSEVDFKAVIDKNIENDFNLMSAFQLVKLLEKSNPQEAQVYRDYILNNYPNSDYANYLRDPNYFVKKKERDALAEQEYVKILDRYNRGLYYPVISKATAVIDNEKDNVFRSKFMLLKALATGQLQENKQLLIPILTQVLEEYPESDEAKKAQEMLDIIENGFSKNIASDFGSKYPFIYNERAKYVVIIFLEPKQKSNMSKSRIVDFQREFFSRESYKVNSKIYGADQSVVIVSEFDVEAEASEYIRVYKKTRKYLLDLQKNKIFMITKDNLKILFQKQDLKLYEEYYEEYY